jgi:hypothetical protein
MGWAPVAIICSCRWARSRLTFVPSFSEAQFSDVPFSDLPFSEGQPREGPSPEGQCCGRTQRLRLGSEAKAMVHRRSLRIGNRVWCWARLRTIDRLACPEGRGGSWR